MSYALPPAARFLMVWGCDCAGAGCDAYAQVGRREAVVSPDVLCDWIINQMAARMLDADAEVEAA